MKTDPARIVLIVIVAICLLLALVVKGDRIINQKINEDEFLTLHNAWSIHQGEVPNRDFWEYHGILYHYLLSPLYYFYDDDISVIWAGRLLSNLFAAGALLLLFFAARTTFSEQAGWIFLLLVPWVLIYAVTANDVRPDQPAAFFSFVALFLLMRSRPAIFLAGIFIGLAALSNQKSIFIGFFMGLTLLTIEPAILKKSLKNAGIYALGILAPVALYLLYLLATGTFSTVMAIYLKMITGNLVFMPSNEDALNLTRLRTFQFIAVQNPTFVIATLAGIVIGVRSLWQKVSVPFAYLAGTLVLMLTTFNHEEQTTLYLIPVMGIFAALSIDHFMNYAQTRIQGKAQILIILGIILVLVVPSMILGKKNLDTHNQSQIATWKWVLKTLPKDESLIDCHAGMYVYRKNDLYHFMIYFSDAQHFLMQFFDSEEDFTNQVMTSITGGNTKMVLLEDVFEDVLPQRALDYIKDNFMLVDGLEVPIYIRELTPAPITP